MAPKSTLTSPQPATSRNRSNPAGNMLATARRQSAPTYKPRAISRRDVIVLTSQIQSAETAQHHALHEIITSGKTLVSQYDSRHIETANRECYVDSKLTEFPRRSHGYPVHAPLKPNPPHVVTYTPATAPFCSTSNMTPGNWNSLTLPSQASLPLALPSSASSRS